MEIWKNPLKLGILITIFNINSYAIPVAKPEITNIKYYSGSWHMAYNDVAVSTDLSVEKLFVDGVLDRQVNAGTTLASLKRGFRLLGTYDTTLCHKAYIVIYNKSNTSVTQSNEFNFGDTSQCNGMSDTTNPVITLTGANPQSVVVGEAYSELGATALDNTDGDLTASINIDATAVDTTTLGEYSVTYSVVDASGNDTLLNRTIKVVNASAVATSEIFAVKYYGGNWNIAYKDLPISPNLGVEKLFVDGTLDRQVNAGTSIPSLRRGFRLLGTYDAAACHTASLVVYNQAGDQIAKTADFNFGDITKCEEVNVCNTNTAITKEALRLMIANGKNVTKVNTCAITDMHGLVSIYYPSWSIDSSLTEEQKTNLTNFNQDISGWNVSKVTNMSGMFYKATAFNQPIGDWDVSSVTDMADMFYKATAFNQFIGNWNVSSVTDMSLMFAGEYNSPTIFNQPIGNWDVSNVRNISYMFYNNSSFNQNISAWDIINITNIYHFYDFARNSNLEDRNNPFEIKNTIILKKINYYNGNWHLNYKDVALSSSYSVEKLFVDGKLDRTVNAGTTLPSLQRGFKLLGTYAEDECHKAYMELFSKNGSKKSITVDFKFGDISSCSNDISEIPNAPKNVRGVRYADIDIDDIFVYSIEFEDFSNNESGFYIYNDGELIKTIKKHNGRGKVLVGIYKNIDDFQAGTIANITVKAFNDVGESEASNRVLEISNFYEYWTVHNIDYSLSKTNKLGLYRSEGKNTYGSFSNRYVSFFYINEDGKMTDTPLSYRDSLAHGYGSESSVGITQDKASFNSLSRWYDEYTYILNAETTKITYDIKNLSNIFILDGERKVCSGRIDSFEDATVSTYTVWSAFTQSWTIIYDKSHEDKGYNCNHDFKIYEEKPIISVIGIDEIVNMGDSYIDKGATGKDTIDGDITDKIVTNNPVNTEQSKVYLVTYNVTDSSGNQAKEGNRTVIVVPSYTKKVITGFYQNFLDREPEFAGFVYWADRLSIENNMSCEEVAYGFINSEEYRDKYKDVLNDDEYIDMLYGALLGRVADSEGKIGWLQELDAGMTRDEVFRGFLDSEEFKNQGSNCENR